ncbi:hypothetical protein C8F01DRAFT_1137727 [Mycena amicta]|nr:hypothetical protein C8F01DRAFT_1137727 [Mycena amicta]
MAACLASSPVWTPLRPSSATWNTKDLSLSSYVSKPKLRLPTMGTTTTTPTPVCRFDPFADDDEPPRMRTHSTPRENIAPTPPALSRGRTPTPLSISVPSSSIIGRRRGTSFSAGSGVRLSSLTSLSLCSLPSPAPSVSRARAAPAPVGHLVPGAPSPFLARHYPTPDARCRLLARTLLHRIHAVGRPRSVYSSSSCSNGYESESGAKPYIPSRLSECVVA